MNKKMIGIISGIVVVCLCIGGYFYFDHQHQQKIIDSISLEFNDMSEVEYGQAVNAESFIKSSSGEIQYQETIDEMKVGKQTLKFIVKKEGHTKEFTYECTVKDTKAPEIILTKTKDQIQFGGKFDMKKYIKSIKDPVDGDLTYKKESDVKEGDTNYYTYHSDVDTKKPKDYKIQLTAVDKNQNKTEKTLSITVLKEEKKTEPTTSSTSSSTSSSSNGSPSKPTYTASPNNKVIVIDPGHQARGNSSKEANGPGSSSMKAKVTTGATGVSSRKAESQINLEIGLKLKSELQARGYTVIMTRTSQGVNISNQQRARIGNQNQAAAVIHLHCDSSNSSSARGAHTIAITKSNPYCSQLYNASSSLARNVISAYSSATGIKSRGVSYRDDLTGLNWSEVPAIYIEMGFISNSSEDQLLTSSSFQDKCAKGIANGIDNYFH
ncbi:MAG: N-acetylmuramoyl-L-alanine amidase family protein [Longibaculum sp.]